jgi:hypothetical protein
MLAVAAYKYITGGESFLGQVPNFSNQDFENFHMPKEIHIFLGQK